MINMEHTLNSSLDRPPHWKIFTRSHERKRAADSARHPGRPRFSASSGKWVRAAFELQPGQQAGPAAENVGVGHAPDEVALQGAATVGHGVGLQPAGFGDVPVVGADGAERSKTASRRLPRRGERRGAAKQMWCLSKLPGLVPLAAPMLDLGSALARGRGTSSAPAPENQARKAQADKHGTRGFRDRGKRSDHLAVEGEIIDAKRTASIRPPSV